MQLDCGWILVSVLSLLINVRNEFPFTNLILAAYITSRIHLSVSVGTHKHDCSHMSHQRPICTRFLQLIDTASHSLLKIPLSHVAFCVQQWNLTDRCFCASPCIGPWFAFRIEFRRCLLYSLMGNHQKLFWAVLQGHCK